MARLIAGVSGGVDSAVAAARAVEAGHEVHAIYLILTRGVGTLRAGAVAPADHVEDARRVADQLGIGFEVWDLSEEFHREVVQDFLDEYARGRTPNPCTRCNERIKFGTVVDRAVALGFEGVVTGHYARLKVREDGVVELHRAVDRAKDQSYVLGVLTQEQLRRCVFPLGESDKGEVRREAKVHGFPVADKPESFDICFIPDGETAEYLYQKLGNAPGEIRDEDGEVLGRHQGVYAYTIGQRKGLRLGSPAGDGRPRYVLGLDSAHNTVIVGPREHLRINGITGTHARWCETPPADTLSGTVQLRAHADEVPALITPTEGGVTIELQSPTYGIAPGQAAVIYRGTQVLGASTIDTTW